MIHDDPPSCQVPLLKICLNGAAGRMGSRIEALTKTTDCSARVTARRDADGSTADPQGDFDVVIDFSSSKGAMEAARIAREAKCALLVGTTGLSDEAMMVLREASRTIPVMVAPNTSHGVVVMRFLVTQATRLLGAGFKVSISETHHTRKLDKPSGTALALARAVVAGGGAPIDPSQIESIRRGEVIGDHEVVFAGSGEVIKLIHHAGTRDLFAQGAIALGRWIASKTPGFYGLDEWFAELAERAH